MNGISFSKYVQLKIVYKSDFSFQEMGKLKENRNQKNVL